MAKKIIVSCLMALLALGAIFWLVGRQGGEKDQDVDQPKRVHRPRSVQPERPAKPGKKTGTKAPDRTAAGHVVEKTDDSAAGEGESSTSDAEEEGEVDEETALVNAFDSLTDKWMEPSSKGVTMDDVQHFAEQFRKIPKARQDECLHRALNLVPDENVMLLAGILMDKTLDKEYLDLVYNDVLNRNDEVKKPILQQILKDREHPCWADTAWILDVTGELPTKTNKK